jgi:uncharacterized protein (TIGR02271 family)
MKMASRSHTVVGVFADHAQAQQAVNELRRRGFSDSQIGVAGRHDSSSTVASDDGVVEGDETYAAEGTTAGLTTGAGIGALWGLGIIAGVLPAIGPAIAGGTLAAILSSAAAGAAAAGLGGALIGLGLSKDEADYYDKEFKSGRTVVTVSAADRVDEAESVLRQYGSYDISNPSSSTTSGTSTGSDMSSSMADRASMDRGTNQSTNQSWGSSSTAGTRSDSSMAGKSGMEHGKQRMTAYEEQLEVEKRPVDTTVNIHKDVKTEHKTIDVPVQREELVIERQPASGEHTGKISGHEEIRVPLHQEEVHVSKEAVAKEDVVIGKRKVSGTERVDETVRKEQIKVDKDDENCNRR